MDRRNPRWWVSPPGPDESLRSLLARVADMYESEPGEVWSRLNAGDPQAAGEVDDPSCAALHRMGQALGVPGASLQAHRLHETPGLLAPAARTAMCPCCWVEDDAAGRPRSYRRAWAHVLRTVCPVHRVHLVIPRDRRQPDLAAAQAQQAALTPDDLQILALIDRLGATLESALCEGAPWPCDWQGSAVSARQALVQVSFNPGGVRGPPVIANVCPSPTLASVVHGPLHYRGPGEAADWEAFRRIADPCVRRAALWVVAWQVVPELPDIYSPGWVDVGPIVFSAA